MGYWLYEPELIAFINREIFCKLEISDDCNL